MKETNWYDITQLAHKHMLLDDQHYGTRWLERIINFAMEVRHIERDACAKLCEEIGQVYVDEGASTLGQVIHFAAAIRARGEKND